MIKKNSIQPDYETKNETKAGNYFVSNYPPFSFWNESDISCVSSLLKSPSPGKAPLGIYYHVPFCRKRCHFCYFKVYTDKNSKDLINGYFGKDNMLKYLIHLEDLFKNA